MRIRDIDGLNTVSWLVGAVLLFGVAAIWVHLLTFVMWQQRIFNIGGLSWHMG